MLRGCDPADTSYGRCDSKDSPLRQSAAPVRRARWCASSDRLRTSGAGTSSCKPSPARAELVETRAPRLAPHLQLGDRGEVPAVERAGAVGLERGEVLGRAVADVGLPTVERMSLGVLAHQPVAVLLGDDRSRRDAR